MFENYGPQKWWIAKLPKYATQGFSYKYVIRPAANYRQAFSFHTFRVIIRHLKRSYKYWFYRCRELVEADLWLPAPPDNNPTVIKRAVLHCLYCVPTQVQLHHKRQPISVHPCSQYHICPFCASRVAEDMYRRFIRATTELKEIDANFIVSYRCERYVFPAKNFTDLGWDHAAFRENILRLRTQLQHEQTKYAKLSKELSTQTLGALWAVVPYPTDNGWTIDVRQLYLTRPKSKRPANRKRNSAELTHKSVSIVNTKQAVELLGEFVRYPSTLLTAHVELTAVVLHARRGLRLLNGAGKLYRKGRQARAQKEVRTAPDVP
jgi:hypothetical protein